MNLRSLLAFLLLISLFLTGCGAQPTSLRDRKLNSKPIPSHSSISRPTSVPLQTK